MDKQWPLRLDLVVNLGNILGCDHVCLRDSSLLAGVRYDECMIKMLQQSWIQSLWLRTYAANQIRFTVCAGLVLGCEGPSVFEL